MKKKWISLVLGAAMIASMGMTVPAAAAETDDAAVEETAAEDITITVNETEIVITNESEMEIESAEVKAAAETDGAEAAWTLTLTAGDGVHTFENASPEKWTNPVLTEDHGFLYIQYTDTDGSNSEALETADEIVPEEELTMWALTNVNMREEASFESTALKVVGLGDECKVVKLIPGWCQVEYDGAVGFIRHKFLTDDKAAAEAAAAQEKAAQDAAAAQAAAAAAASQSYSYSYSDSGSSGGGNNGGGNGGGGNAGGDECLTGGLLN